MSTAATVPEEVTGPDRCHAESRHSVACTTGGGTSHGRRGGASYHRQIQWSLTCFAGSGETPVAVSYAACPAGWNRPLGWTRVRVYHWYTTTRAQAPRSRPCRRDHTPGPGWGADGASDIVAALNPETTWLDCSWRGAAAHPGQSLRSAWKAANGVVSSVENRPVRCARGEGKGGRPEGIREAVA